jgi:hypothetical protein
MSPLNEHAAYMHLGIAWQKNLDLNHILSPKKQAIKEAMGLNIDHNRVYKNKAYAIEWIRADCFSFLLSK